MLAHHFLSVIVITMCATTINTAVDAYHQGGSDTNCWKNDYKELVNPCDNLFEVELENIPSSDEILYTDQLFNVTARLILKPESNMTLYREPISGQQDVSHSKPSYLVPHANVHMCRVEVGWCTPDVREQVNLVSQTLPIASDSTGTKIVDLKVTNAGDWMITVHYTFYTGLNERWDVAAGIRRKFVAKKEEYKVADWSVFFIMVLSMFGIVLAVVTGAGVWFGRNHWVLRASSPNLSIAVVAGCILAFVSVFVLLPPNSSMAFRPQANAQCQSRVWLLALAFDLVVIPLALKTWRVSVLFDSETSFKTRPITDKSLFKLAFALICADMLLCLIWTIVHPLKLSIVPSAINPNEIYTMQCVGQDQAALEIIAFLLHGVPLIWLAMVGRRVRFSFRQREFLAAHAAARVRSSLSASSENRRMSQFNETESISLALASLAFVSVFAIALQYTVKDSPSARTLMIAGGTLWEGFFILLVLFVPKFLDYCKYEQDGVTERQTSATAQVASAVAKALNSSNDMLTRHVRSTSLTRPRIASTIRPADSEAAVEQLPEADSKTTTPTKPVKEIEPVALDLDLL